MKGIRWGRDLAQPGSPRRDQVEECSRMFTEMTSFGIILHLFRWILCCDGSGDFPEAGRKELFTLLLLILLLL